MDPSLSDESLQKTSPLQDPAAFTHLCSTMSAQASQLTAHQHQLNRLTSLTEELVKALQGLQAPAPAASLPPAAATITHAVGTPSQGNPRLSLPEKFDGDPTKCKGFVLQCSLFINQQPTLYTTDAGKIFVCSLFTSKAFERITAVWGDDGAAFPSFEYFMQRFREVFDHPSDGKGAGDRLMELTQGLRTTAEYALAFRTFAAQTNWVSDTLKVCFRRGLSHELQAELACRDEGKSLDQFIELTIHIDNLIRSRKASRRRSARPSPPMKPEPSEPMQINSYHLSEEERSRRFTHRLCLYCGSPGHMRNNCPVRSCPENPRSVSDTKPHYNSDLCVSVPITLLFDTRRLTTPALLDSGAAGNFMSQNFAQENNIPLIECSSSLAVEAIDGRPLGSGRVNAISQQLTMITGLFHTETIQFHILPTSTSSIILGLPWLRTHNPQICWREGQITHWNELSN